MLKFESVDLEKIGRKCGLRDHQWATLKLRVTDTENDHSHAVSIDVLVPRRPDATMRELEEAAQSEAKAILSASLDLLQGSTVGELLSQEYAAADAHDEEIERQLKSPLGDSWQLPSQ